MDRCDSGEAGEIRNVEGENLRHAVQQRDGGQPRIMGVLATNTVVLDKGKPAGE
jgi:hypothetical protein